MFFILLPVPAQNIVGELQECTGNIIVEGVMITNTLVASVSEIVQRLIDETQSTIDVLFSSIHPVFPLKIV